MRKNFTRLISSVTRTKSFAIALTSLMILAGSVYLMAAVGVTVTGGGTFPISADLAANATLTTPSYTPIGAITIREESVNDFASSGNIVLRAPAGWRFRSTGVTRTAGLFDDNGTTNITLGAAAYSSDGSTITFSLTVNNTNKRDEIVISGVQVQALDGTSIPATGSIRVEVSGGALVSGLPTTLSQSISQAPGAVKQLAFITQPSDELLGESITPAVQVQARDQFSNIVPNPSISLALGSNPGSGSLIAGTSSTSNGVVTFSGYSINRVGIGYTLSASSTGASSVISNAFTVNNRKPTISTVSGCLSVGDPATTITITGTNFVTGATMLVNGQSRPATFTNSTTLTTSISAAELASAGNLSIVVKNPAPAQDNGESEAFSKPVNALQSAGTISGVSEICPGESNVELSVPTNSDVTSYQWTVVSGGATIVSGGNTRTARLNFGNTAGPVQVSVVAFNTCGKPGPATTRTITIKPTPVVTVSAQNDDTAVCQGESVVLSAAGANSYVWSGTGIAAGTTGNTLTVTPTVTTTYTVIGTTDDCPSAPRTITINVTPALTQGVISGVNEYCHNASATAITASITGGGSATKSYKWERSTTGANGLWTEVGTSANFTPLTTATGTSWYRRTVSAGECSVTSAAFPVLVKSNPTITVEASENAICQGETVELTAEGADSYIWSGTGMPAGATSDKVTVTPTVTTTYTVVGVIDGCQSTPQTVTITVTPTLTQGAITGVTQYCQTVGGFGTALSSTVGGGVAAKSYLWEQSPNGTSDWEPAENTNNGASYTPSISEAGTMYYRRAVESGSCVSIGEPVAVTVTPSITNTITSANQVVCSGETISQITGTVLGGSPDEVSYQWEQSANGTSGWGDAPGASKDLNYTPEEEVVNTSKTTYYRRKVVSGNCTSFSEPVSIRIVAMPIAEILDGANDYFCPPASATLTARTGTGYRYTWYKVVQGGDDEHVGTDQNTYTTNVEGYYYVVVKGENDCTTTSSVTQVQSTILNTNIISGAQTICYNAIPTTLEGQTSTSDLGTVTYQWRVSSNGTSFSNITGATDKDFTFTSSLTGDKWYRRVARVGSGCSITSEPVKVTVKPLLRVTNLASASSALCTGTAFTFSPEGSEGSKSFTWTRAEVVGISNDAASGTGGINETLVNTTAAAVNVTYMYTTSDDEGCSGPVQNLVVRVNPTPTLSSLLAPPAICGGAEFDYTARSATSNTTFSWVRKPVAGITTTADASGSGARVEHILTNTTPNPIDVTYTYTLTANGCSNTQNVVVRVNPRPHLNTTLTPAAICSGATFSYEPDSDTEEETYTWTRTAPASISGGATSGTGSISQVLTNASANPVNVTYQFITSANSCAGTPQDVVVTVNPSPKLSSLLTANVCSGNTFSYEPASATEGSTFSWSRSASGGNAASSGTGNISEVLTNTTTAPITVTYEITARANGCNGEPQNLVVTVHPRPVLNNIPTSASVCSGSVFSYTPQSLTPNASFTWTRAAVNGISNAAVTSPRAGSISETLVNTTTDPIDVTYVYTTTANNCAGSEQNVVITVNPRPVLSSTLTADPVCSGTPFSYTPQSATIGATFSWTRAAVANISNTAVTTAVAGDINETLINTGTAPVTVTYKYTTTYASNGSSCSGTEQDVKVVVNPSPKLSSTLTPTAVCSSSTFSYTPTSATTGATYTWTRAAVAGISNTAVTDGTGAVSETLVNTTANTINVTYVYIITANGCTGTPQNVTVRVNPKPDATFSGVTDGQIVYSDGGTISLTPTVAGGNFSIVSPSGTNGMTSGGVLTPCTALVSETEKEITIRYTLAQTSNSVACNAFEEKKVILKRSKYVVVIEAVPFPTCRGQNTTYRAVVYKDPVSVTYPYLVNGDGQPVDGQGNLLGAKTYPIPNPAYPFPANAPQILKDNAYRYYQPIVNGGVRVNDDANASNFTYRWTKNFDNFPFGDKVEVGNAGLSSEDYYAVSITAGPTNSCISPITNGGLWSNRTYTAAPINYVVDLVTDKTTICQDGEITMSANLDAAFAFWKDIELTLYWMVQRPGITAPIQLGSTTYTTGNTVTFNSTGPTGGFRDGDLVFVEFSSVIDRQNDVNSKCSRGFTTNQVALTVVGTQTMTGGGAYCAGGGGVPVGLASSQRNVFYQLKRDGANVGTPMAGTGNALNFANQTVAGAYTVEAQAASGETACLTYGPVNVNVTPLPVVQTLTTENDGEFCAGGIGVPITLSNSQTGVKYQLVRTVNGTTTNVGLEVLGSDGQPIPFGNQTEAGVYSVEATTLPATGTIAACPQTMGSVIVTVNQLPTVTVNSPTICEGSTATITAEPAGGTGPYTYTWSVPAGFTNPGNVASFSTTVPGTYTVSIGDSKSCASSAAATSTVIVNELPTVTVNSPTVCAGTAATVTATPADGVGPYSYTWTVPAGATNPGNVASFPTSVAGQYSVRIQDSQSCSSSEVATSTVTINPVLPVTARILIFDETGTQIEDESKMEFGMKYTFEVESNMIDLNGVDISSIKWWMGDGTTEGWVMVEQGVTQFTMKEPMGALRVSIKCDIPALPGTCFALDASNIFSIFTDPIVPLPVELLYFNATKRGNDVVLDWATASELDNKGFEVQVSSDAKNFRALGFVESKVNTTSLKQLYTFVDKENGKQGVRYYRLKQVDLDGKFEIFNVKAVHFDEVSVNKVKAYPNPFHSEVELSIDAELDGELQITVTTATGQQLLQRSVQVVKGTNIEKLTLDPNLPRGVYIISTRMGDFNSHFKLLKQ